jgi:hypothetical protein
MTLFSLAAFTTMIALARFLSARSTAVGLSRRTAIALGLAGALGSAACDKVPLTAPTGSTVTLFSNTTIVPVNGAAEITATVVESGGTLVQNGTLVTFTTTIGNLDPGEARTRDGKVTVRLMAGSRSGRAVVRAFSGGVTSGDLTVDIGGAAAGRISLTANPSNVSASGGTSTLLAIVFDVDGNRLPGVPVSFTADAGTFASTVAVTNGAGEATTTITTNRETTVTASAGGASGGSGSSGGGENGGGGAAAAVTATVKITVSPLPTVKITAPTGATLVPGVPVTFAVEAAATAPATVRTITVDFGDGQPQTFGNTTSVAHTYRNAGSYNVTATVEDSNGGRGTGSTTVVILSSEIAVELTGPTGPVNPGAIVSFRALVTQNPGSVAVESVLFDFGDGNVRRVDGVATTHIYGASGNFTASATVRLVNGQTGVGSTAVRVN